MRGATTVFVICFVLKHCEGVSYYNHAMLRGVPYDYEQLKFFKTLDTLYNVTWWRKPSLIHNAVEFSISPRNLATLFRDTEQMTIKFHTIIKNIQSAFDNQKAGTYNRRKLQSFNWNSYYRLDDIYDWIKDLSAKHPEEVQLRRVGHTHENRTILGVRLILKGSKNRGKVIVEGGCHGREWISPAFVTYMLYTLLNAKKYRSEELEVVAYEYTWIFVPVMNPDGYEYSHTTDRLWRKNRRPEGGVDLNRNYGIAFGTHSTQSKPSSYEYCGEDAFSEPESYSMAALAREHKNHLKYYLSFHAYGQYIILPYNHLIEHEDNFKMVKAEADKAVKRMEENHGIRYKAGNGIETVGYLASGVSADWVKRALNITYVLTFELPDKGIHGFALPAAQILPVCQATMDGLLPLLTPKPSYLRTGQTDGTSNKGQEKRVYTEFALVCNVFLYFMNSLFNDRLF